MTFRGKMRTATSSATSQLLSLSTLPALLKEASFSLYYKPTWIALGIWAGVSTFRGCPPD